MSTSIPERQVLFGSGGLQMKQNQAGNFWMVGGDGLPFLQEKAMESMAIRNCSGEIGAMKPNGFFARLPNATALHLAQLLLTLGRALTAAGAWLYNLTPNGYRQPPRCAWDHDNPRWSDGFYEALGRQEWERKRDR